MKITMAEAAEALGVSVDCEDEAEINKAYKRMALKCHPDKAVDMTKEQAGASR
jgi:DnaJ-class molecular chaperone